jgi:hypothetical protein
MMGRERFERSTSGLKVRMYSLALILVRKAQHFSFCYIIVAFFKNASILIKYLYF